MTNCPSCAHPVPLPTDAVEGEVVACTSCSIELEVIAVEPPEFALAPELSEDWGE